MDRSERLASPAKGGSVSRPQAVPAGCPARMDLYRKTTRRRRGNNGRDKTGDLKAETIEDHDDAEAEDQSTSHRSLRTGSS